MVGRDEVNLTAEERAMLARLEARIGQDQRLARRFANRHRHRRLRFKRLAGWTERPLAAVLLLLAGLALTVLGVSTGPIVAGVGHLITAVGLWRIIAELGAVVRRQTDAPMSQCGQDVEQ